MTTPRHPHSTLSPFPIDLSPSFSDWHLSGGDSRLSLFCWGCRRPTDFESSAPFGLSSLLFYFVTGQKFCFFQRSIKNGNLATRHTKCMFKPHIFGNRQIETRHHDADDMWLVSRGTSLNFGVDKVESLIFPFVFTFVARTPTRVG